MNSLPGIMKRNNGFTFMVNNRPFILLAAETHNSAGTSREYMVSVWKKLEELNCNTVLVPIPWESIEPREDYFDFALVEELINGARKHNKKLVFLWFGTWKNGHSTYVPSWIKTDLTRFPRTENEYGIRSRTLSMFGSGILETELKSFRKLIQYIKKTDEGQQTVIALQIENEVGILDAARDFSAAAAEAFEKNVPVELPEHFRKTENDFFIQMIKRSEHTSDQSWQGMFGEAAGEVFMCWHYARYLNELAAVAKESYALPVFTNVWLNETDDEKPGFYPCGGPIPEMIDVWKRGAPCLDFIAPDIYTFEFDKFAGLYTRDDNPLFIAETRRDKWAAANLYTAIGKYNALCYSPFGAESVGENKSFITQKMHTDSADKNVSSELVKEYLSQSYKLLGNMMPIISEYYGTDKMTGFSQDESRMSKQIKLGKYQISIEFYHRIDDENEFIPAAGIIMERDENELIFAGYGYRAYLNTVNPGKQLDFLSLEKGFFDEEANWVNYMDLNGDEQHIQMEEKVTILKAVFYEF